MPSNAPEELTPATSLQETQEEEPTVAQRGGRGRKRAAEGHDTAPSKRQKRVAATAKRVYEELHSEEEVQEIVQRTPKKGGTPRKAKVHSTRKIAIKVEGVTKAEAEEEDIPALAKGSVRKGYKKSKVEVKEEVKAEEEEHKDGTVIKKVKKKRKTKEEKEAEAMPIAARTIGSKLFLGAHVSAAGGMLVHFLLYYSTC